MMIPEVHELGARVLVHPSDSRPPYETIVQGYIGNAQSGALDREAEWYWFTSSQRPQDRAPAERLKRIVRVAIPGGDTFEGVCYGTITDLEGNLNSHMVGYNVSYLREPNTVRWVDPSWVQPL